MYKKTLLALAALTISTSAAASASQDIVNAPNIYEVGTAAPEANSFPLKEKPTPELATEAKTPSLQLKNYISVGYLMPDGFADVSEDASDGVAVELGVYVADYKFKGHFDTFSITNSGKTKDIQAFGLGIEKSLYRVNEVNFIVGVGFERFDIAGDIEGFTDGDTAFSASDFNTETMFATLGTEFALTPSISVGLTARYDFSHDDVSLTLNGKHDKLYEDVGFTARIDYEMNETIGFALVHESPSALMTQTRFDVKYKF